MDAGARREWADCIRTDLCIGLVFATGRPCANLAASCRFVPTSSNSHVGSLLSVVVVQLSGKKRWSVAREPIVYLAGKDQKRKPTPAELIDLRRYDEFTLCPGDVVYIPRGFVHNASTILFDELEESEGDGGGRSGGGRNLDRCPDYPPSARHLADRLNGPSLHITFGLLQSHDATVEALLHHALRAFFEEVKEARGVAVPRRRCPDPSQADARHDVRWKAVLHHALGEAARRPHRCDKASANGVEYGAQERCDGTAVLRRSVPLLLLSKNQFQFAEGGNESPQRVNLKKTYMQALRTFVAAADVDEIVNFVQSQILQRPNDGTDASLVFDYPGYVERDFISCPASLKSLSVDAFQRRLRSFEDFARTHYDRVLTDMNVWAMKKRENSRKADIV
ncbi:hypothetical protein ACHAWF_016182 [Thalassiosira exigua]